MENFIRAMVLLAHCVAASQAFAAPPASMSQREALAGLEAYRETLATASNRCSLGFLAAGSPFTITRVSDWNQNSGMIEADQLLEVNGVAIRSETDLHEALDKLEFLDPVTLVLSRNDEVLRVHTRCQDGTSVNRAREEALLHASEGRWDECIRATYMEEVYWGGANSQSAALRLWCNRARGLSDADVYDLHTPSETLSRLDAHLIYEHADNLLDELQHVPGGLDGLRMTLYNTIRLLDDSGYLLLSSELDTKFSALDRKLIASR
jgi:hypothetical protein